MIKFLTLLPFMVALSISSLVSGAPLKLEPDFRKTAFYASIKEFEQKGAKGQWLRVTSPFTESGAPEYFYLLKKAPVTADSRSSVWLGRLPHSLNLVKDLVTDGAVLIFADLPEGTGKAAGTFDSSFLITREVARLSHKPVTSVIVLPLTADKYTLAHENQHVKDFASVTFAKNLEVALKNWFQANYLTEEEKADLESGIREIRGYSRQEIDIKKDSAKNLQLLDRGGNISAGSRRKPAGRLHL